MTTFRLLILIAFGFFFACLSVTKSYHLMLEQAWSANLQRMVTADIHVISAQNKYIDDLHDLILSLPKE